MLLLLFGIFAAAENLNQTLEGLVSGNQRFLEHHAQHPNQSADRVLKLSKRQNPQTVMITCSDSRVAPEIVFDQGLGDFFTIRTAGHALSMNDIASIEYAVMLLGAQQIVVMGHTYCGAVQASVHQDSSHTAGSKSLESLVSQIKKGIGNIESNDHDFSKAARNNVRSTLQFILIHSPMIRASFLEKKVFLAEGMYDIQTAKANLTPLSQ